MIEYLQFRVGSHSFYRGFVDGQSRTLVRQSDFSEDQLALARALSDAPCPTDNKLSVLCFNNRIVIDEEAYFSTEPIAIYEPLRPLSSAEAARVTLSVMDLYQSVSRNISSGYCNFIPTPDSLFLRLSDKRIVLWPILCEHQKVSEHYKAKRFQLLWNYLIQKQNGCRANEGKLLLKYCKSLAEIRKELVLFLNDEAGTNIRSQRLKYQTHRVRTEASDESLLARQPSASSRHRSSENIHNKKNVIVKRLSLEKRISQQTRKRSEREEILGEFTRTICLKTEEKTAPKKQSARLKKRSIQAISLLNMVRASQLRKTADTSLASNCRNTQTTRHIQFQRLCPTQRNPSLPLTSARCYTEAIRPKQSSTESICHLHTTGNEATVDIGDVILQEQHKQSFSIAPPPPQTASDSLPQEADRPELFSESSSLGTVEGKQNSQGDISPSQVHQEPPPMTFDIYEQLAQLQLGIFAKYNRIGQLASTSSVKFGRLKVSWQLPIFLLYRKFVQVRVCLLESLHCGENLLALPQWQDIIKSQEFHNWLERLSTDNDCIIQAAHQLRTKILGKSRKNRHLLMDDASNQAHRQLFRSSKDLYQRLRHLGIETACRQTLYLACELANCLLLACGEDTEIRSQSSSTLSVLEQQMARIDQQLNKIQLFVMSH